MLTTALVAALFGLLVGSFLNVCIVRLPLEKSVVTPRSACPQCGSQLRWWHNVPVISFLLLRGRCAFCGKSISWQYPLVEILTSICLGLAVLTFGLTTAALLNAFFFCMVIVLVFIDLRERILPDPITLGGTVLGFLLAPLQSPELLGFTNLWEAYLQSALGILCGGGILWLVATLYLKFRGREGMGFGDIKMMAMVGAFLGWRLAWLTIFVGSLAGALIGAVFMYASRKSRNYELPFGTFLGLAAIIVTLWGNAWIDWYAALL